MAGEFDLDEPVEIRVRGWFADVLGYVTALSRVEEFEGDFEGLERTKKAASDVIEQADQQVNLGYLERELKRAERNPDEFPEYGGIQVIVSSFNPRHPDETAPSVERLSPLEDADYYVILQRNEEGFEAAGHPENLGIEESMQLASFLRTYARDLEGALEQTEEVS